MSGVRAAMLDGPPLEAIDQQLSAIEDALERVPDFAFDLSKVLIESVCKTLLADLGQPADPNWDCPRLFKETANRHSLLPANHPDPKSALDSIKRTVNGLAQTVQGLCELRQKFGLASHGRDVHAARLSQRQAALAAQAADTITAFLYIMHRDAVNRKPADRLYYEDHKDFNEGLDRDNEQVRVAGVTLDPSRVLYHTDPEAYRDALSEYITTKSGASGESAPEPDDAGESPP